MGTEAERVRVVVGRVTEGVVVCAICGWGGGAAADADAALGSVVDVVCDRGEEVQVPVLRNVPVECVRGIDQGEEHPESLQACLAHADVRGVVAALHGCEDDYGECG